MIMEQNDCIYFAKIYNWSEYNYCRTAEVNIIVPTYVAIDIYRLLFLVLQVQYNIDNTNKFKSNVDDRLQFNLSTIRMFSCSLFHTNCKHSVFESRYPEFPEVNVEHNFRHFMED